MLVERSLGHRRPFSDLAHAPEPYKVVHTHAGAVSGIDEVIVEASTVACTVEADIACSKLFHLFEVTLDVALAWASVNSPREAHESAVRGMNKKCRQGRRVRTQSAAVGRQQKMKLNKTHYSDSGEHHQSSVSMPLGESGTSKLAEGKQRPPDGLGVLVGLGLGVVSGPSSGDEVGLVPTPMVPVTPP